MGHKSCAALFMLIFLAALMSGCTQTGRIVNKTEASSTAQQPQQAAAEIYVNPAGQENESTPDAPEEPAVQASPANPCEGITCPDSVTLCDDGFKARCRNVCSSGACSICMPGCAGHGLCDRVACNDSVKACPGSGTASCKNTCSKGACSNCTPQCQAGQQPGGSQCELSCGACRDANYQKCSCDLIVPCRGNGICEQGEYPGADCQDCNDSSSCTEDLYNYTSGRCYHDVIAPCCGNGACENQTESHATCPQDCPAQQNGTSTAGRLAITEIMYNPTNESSGEYVEIYNPNAFTVNVSGWKLSDESADIEILRGFSGGSHMLLAGAYAVITDEDTAVAIPAAAIHLTTGDNAIGNGLKNSGEAVSLFYHNGTLADFVNYTMPPQCGNDFSIQLISQNWICKTGSPGAANA